MRAAQLGSDRIQLLGRVPRCGERLTAEFVIPAARLADKPLTAVDLLRGLVVVSTLPNIQKHACLAQIVELEERGHEQLPNLKIVHVSADHEDHWREVDRFHPDLKSAGYSLCCAEPVHRDAFVRAFGVGVRNHHRIAHGLFALRDGMFLMAEVPDDQMRAADVRRFLVWLAENVEVPHEQAPQQCHGG